MTDDHIGTAEEVLASPIIYMPCLARLEVTYKWVVLDGTRRCGVWRANPDLSRTLILFGVLRNPQFLALLLRTKETITIVASSPCEILMSVFSC